MSLMLIDVQSYIDNFATKLIGREHNQLSNIYNVALKMKALQIFHDDAHPLNAAFHILPSGRRLKVPLARKILWKKYVIPSAILMLNAKHYICVYLLVCVILL